MAELLETPSLTDNLGEQFDNELQQMYQARKKVKLPQYAPTPSAQQRIGAAAQKSGLPQPERIAEGLTRGVEAAAGPWQMASRAFAEQDSMSRINKYIAKKHSDGDFDAVRGASELVKEYNSILASNPEQAKTFWEKTATGVGGSAPVMRDILLTQLGTEAIAKGVEMGVESKIKSSMAKAGFDIAKQALPIGKSAIGKFALKFLARQGAVAATGVGATPPVQAIAAVGNAMWLAYDVIKLIRSGRAASQAIRALPAAYEMAGLGEGEIISSLAQDGVKVEDIPQSLVTAGGLLYGASEFMSPLNPADKLSSHFIKTMVANSIKKNALKIAGKTAITTSGEVLEEGAQSVITDVTKNEAKQAAAEKEAEAGVYRDVAEALKDPKYKQLRGADILSNMAESMADAIAPSAIFASVFTAPGAFKARKQTIELAGRQAEAVDKGYATQQQLDDLFANAGASEQLDTLRGWQTAKEEKDAAAEAKGIAAMEASEKARALDITKSEEGFQARQNTYKQLVSEGIWSDSGTKDLWKNQIIDDILANYKDEYAEGELVTDDAHDGTGFMENGAKAQTAIEKLFGVKTREEVTQKDLATKLGVLDEYRAAVTKNNDQKMEEATVLMEQKMADLESEMAPFSDGTKKGYRSKMSKVAAAEIAEQMAPNASETQKKSLANKIAASWKDSKAGKAKTSNQIIEEIRAQKKGMNVEAETKTATAGENNKKINVILRDNLTGAKANTPAGQELVRSTLQEAGVKDPVVNKDNFVEKRDDLAERVKHTDRLILLSSIRNSVKKSIVPNTVKTIRELHQSMSSEGNMFSKEDLGVAIEAMVKDGVLVETGEDQYALSGYKKPDVEKQTVFVPLTGQGGADTTKPLYFKGRAVQIVKTSSNSGTGAITELQVSDVDGNVLTVKRAAAHLLSNTLEEKKAEAKKEEPKKSWTEVVDGKNYKFTIAQAYGRSGPGQSGARIGTTTEKKMAGKAFVEKVEIDDAGNPVEGAKPVVEEMVAADAFNKADPAKQTKSNAALTTASQLDEGTTSDAPQEQAAPASEIDEESEYPEATAATVSELATMEPTKEFLTSMAKAKLIDAKGFKDVLNTAAELAVLQSENSSKLEEAGTSASIDNKMAAEALVVALNQVKSEDGVRFNAYGNKAIQAFLTKYGVVLAKPTIKPNPIAAAKSPFLKQNAPTTGKQANAPVQGLESKSSLRGGPRSEKLDKITEGLEKLLSTEGGLTEFGKDKMMLSELQEAWRNEMSSIDGGKAYLDKVDSERFQSSSFGDKLVSKEQAYSILSGIATKAEGTVSRGKGPDSIGIVKIGNTTFNVEYTDSIRDPGSNNKIAFGSIDKNGNKSYTIKVSRQNGLVTTLPHEFGHAVRDAVLISNPVFSRQINAVLGVDLRTPEGDEAFTKMFETPESRQALGEKLRNAPPTAQRGIIKYLNALVDFVNGLFGTEFKRFGEVKKWDDFVGQLKDFSLIQEMSDTSTDEGFERWQGGYSSAPDSLMGFKKNAQSTPYEEADGYKQEITVSVKLPNGEEFVDGMRGLNTTHAMERARRNWSGAEITLVSEKPLADTSRLHSKPMEETLPYDYQDFVKAHAKKAGGPDALQTDFNERYKKQLAGPNPVRSRDVYYITQARQELMGSLGYMADTKLASSLVKDISKMPPKVWTKDESINLYKGKLNAINFFQSFETFLNGIHPDFSKHWEQMHLAGQIRQSSAEKEVNTSLGGNSRDGIGKRLMVEFKNDKRVKPRKFVTANGVRVLGDLNLPGDQEFVLMRSFLNDAMLDQYFNPKAPRSRVTDAFNGQEITFSKGATREDARRLAVEYFAKNATLGELNMTLNGIFDKLYDHIAPIFKKITGKELKKEDFYMRMFALHPLDARSAQTSRVQTYLDRTPSTKERKAHNYGMVVEPFHKSITRAIDDSLHFIGMAEPMKNIRDLLTVPVAGRFAQDEETAVPTQLARTINEKFGNGTTQNAITRLNNIEGSFDVNDPKGLRQALKFTNILKLAGPSSFLKQAGAIFVAPLEFGWQAWARGAKNRYANKKQIEEIIDSEWGSPLWQRIKSANNAFDEIKDAYGGSMMGKTNQVLGEKTLVLMRMADRDSVKHFVSMAIENIRAANPELEASNKDEFTKQVAQKAIRAVNNIQPTGWRGLRTGVHNANFLGEVLNNFRTSPNAVFNTVWRKYQDAKRSSDPVKQYKALASIVLATIGSQAAYFAAVEQVLQGGKDWFSKDSGDEDDDVSLMDGIFGLKKPSEVARSQEGETTYKRFMSKAIPNIASQVPNVQVFEDYIRVLSERTMELHRLNSGMAGINGLTLPAVEPIEKFLSDSMRFLDSFKKESDAEKRELAGKKLMYGVWKFLIPSSASWGGAYGAIRGAQENLTKKQEPPTKLDFGY